VPLEVLGEPDYPRCSVLNALREHITVQSAVPDGEIAVNSESVASARGFSQRVIAGVHLREHRVCCVCGHRSCGHKLFSLPGVTTSVKLYQPLNLFARTGIARLKSWLKILAVATFRRYASVVLDIASHASGDSGHGLVNVFPVAANIKSTYAFRVANPSVGASIDVDESTVLTASGSDSQCAQATASSFEAVFPRIQHIRGHVQDFLL
jgi:hypothetical protein